MRAIGWIIGALMACATATASAQTRAPTETERLEELGRLWIYFELFSAHVATSGVDWDAALVETIPAVRRARTEAQYVAALNAMLARSGDPSARVIRDEEESQAAPPATRIEAGVAIANCSTIAAAADVPAALTELAQTPRGVVLDCRAFNVPWERAEAFIAALARSRTAQTLPAGATMVRAYSGYPPEEDGFRGYSAALSLVQEASIAPGRGAPSAHPLAIVIDAGMAPYLPTLAALRTAGAARLVADGGVGNGRVWVDIGADRWALMSRGVYIYPNGASGFRADASAGEDAVGAALALLSAPPAPTASAITPLLQGRPPHAYAGDDEAPPVEMRLLALYRLWGTIEYFFPYHELTDRPWDDTLEEFIPLFRDANTRAAYETAVLRLVARMQDRHAGEVRGLRAILYAAAPDRPNLATRYVQGRLAITAVRDAEVSDRVFVGDEILAVDNVPISQLEARLTPLISHSTPQSLRGLLSWYVLAGPEDSQAELTLRGADGAVRTVRVARSTPRRPPAEESPIWRTLEG
ncbi:MAG: hypothetical protein ACREH4_05435, partial [Vitreimonas sp.]